jgi:hypothetical protein
MVNGLAHPTLGRATKRASRPASGRGGAHGYGAPPSVSVKRVADPEQISAEALNQSEGLECLNSLDNSPLARMVESYLTYIGRITDEEEQ